MLTEINKKVLSYCEIPEEIVDNNGLLQEVSCDSYIDYSIPNKHKMDNFSYNELDEWIISNYPELEGESFLIHIDY